LVVLAIQSRGGTAIRGFAAAAGASAANTKRYPSIPTVRAAMAQNALDQAGPRFESVCAPIENKGFRIRQRIWVGLWRQRYGLDFGDNMVTIRLRLAYFQATATAARHMFIADERKARCVLAEVRWRRALKEL